jgi:predicted NBD/HSP70 family sugar kinase
MLNGRLHRGTAGAAGEIGYLPVPGADLPRDISKRGKGAFQQVAGADAVRQVAREHGFKASSAGDAVRAAIAAGTKGGPVLDELARRLALGVAAVGGVLDPPLMVLAGEVGRAGGTPLAERVQHEVAAITPVSPRVVVSTVGEDPVLRGALLTGLDAVRDQVFGSTVE